MAYLHRKLGYEFSIRLKCNFVHYSVLAGIDRMNMLCSLCPAIVLQAPDKNIQTVKDRQFRRF